MKHWLFALCVLLPIAACAGWIDDSGKNLPQSANMRSAGSFGAQLALTGDDGEFRRMWEDSPSRPVLRATNRVKRGSSISAMLIFSGCEAGRDGKCNVTADFVLIAPDGKRIPAASTTVWNKEPIPGKLLLAGSSMTVMFTGEDAPGSYAVVVAIIDRVAGKRLSLVGKVLVE